MNAKIRKIIEIYKYLSYREIQLNNDEKSDLDLEKLKYIEQQLPLRVEWISYKLKKELDLYNSKIFELKKRINDLFKTRIWKKRDNNYENRTIQTSTSPEKLLEFNGII
ncbi:hypothetical protein [Carnobacterium maltaromaticum]|uniref:hypothetical protein n=1 Tax=Carnobacterium maltaromaticum TaxID=2751 RepID=UPI001D99301A|nr:hypothetical protein [Carnobacterium maltaromaticum]MCC4313212.1 hypothetical protein [Carnobacterium maltaromaticum]